MIASPSNLIEGLILVVQKNAGRINSVIRKYDANGSLHLFKGIRKSLPLNAFPSLEMEPVSGAMDWVTTSAMTGEYAIDCVLTVKTGANSEGGVEYISDLARALMELFNFPGNMTWKIPGEFLDKGRKVPLFCQYSEVRSVDYLASKDYAIRVARWQLSCKTVEGFPEPHGIAPQNVNWR